MTSDRHFILDIFRTFSGKDSNETGSLYDINGKKYNGAFDTLLFQLGLVLYQKCGIRNKEDLNSLRKTAFEKAKFNENRLENIPNQNNKSFLKILYGSGLNILVSTITSLKHESKPTPDELRKEWIPIMASCGVEGLKDALAYDNIGPSMPFGIEFGMIFSVIQLLDLVTEKEKALIQQMLNALIESQRNISERMSKAGKKGARRFTEKTEPLKQDIRKFFLDSSFRSQFKTLSRFDEEMSYMHDVDARTVKIHRSNITKELLKSHPDMMQELADTNPSLNKSFNSIKMK